MASALIHISVAKCVNEKIKRNEKMIFLGTIAPDLSKFIGRTKIESHFIQGFKDVPNLKKFIDKYPDFKNNDFLLGYYIHLYTDKIWFQYFINNYIQNQKIKLLDGTILTASNEMKSKILYNDYTNLNIELIEKYNLDLSLFYEQIEIPNISFDELPLNKLQVIVDKMGIIIKNSKEEKKYILDIDEIEKFINNTTNSILEELL